MSSHLEAPLKVSWDRLIGPGPLFKNQDDSPQDELYHWWCPKNYLRITLISERVQELSSVCVDAESRGLNNSIPPPTAISPTSHNRIQKALGDIVFHLSIHPQSSQCLTQRNSVLWSYFPKWLRQTFPLAYYIVKLNVDCILRHQALCPTFGGPWHWKSPALVHTKNSYSQRKDAVKMHTGLIDAHVQHNSD